MKYSYYPGCTLKTKAKDLDVYAHKSAEALGVELVEVKEWQCCGGVYPLGSDEIATKLSSVRTLNEAKENNIPLDEGIGKAILGAAAGVTVGPAIMKSVCKVLGISESGALGNLMTSRLVLTALGGYLGYKN